MTRRGARLAAAVLLLAGCGSDETLDGPPDATPVDSVLVGVLADVGLAEARAGLARPERRGAVRDSLRAVALAAHGWSAERLDEATSDLARDPVATRATYDAVERLLTEERFAPAAPGEP